MSLVEPVELAESGRRRRVAPTSPESLEPLGSVEVQGPADVARARDRARRAQEEWAARSVADRGRFLLRAARALVDLEDEFAEVIRRETGKPQLEALAMEVLTGCDLLNFFGRRAERILADERVPLHLLKNKRLELCYRPRGVVAAITPWNFPFFLSLNVTAQALVAGNAVLLKPSEWTTQSGRLVEELFQAVDLPEGLVQCLTGDGETGRALVACGVDQVCFTGSVEAGRKVAEACGRALIPCTLELGGKDPMIVCADADLERASAAAVFGAFANSGQVCTSTERVYVADEVADLFTRKVLEKTAALRQGPQGESDVGPVTLDDQLATIEAHVADAVSKGARVLAGGRRNPEYAGRFFEPTVLVDVHHEMRVMNEETFGPVMPIMRVRDDEEAVRWANETSFGLDASIFSRDKRKAIELAKRLRTGSAVVNDCFINAGMPEAPFGGRGQSGLGQVGGEIGLRSFCHPQSIAIDRFGGKSEYLWFPYTARKTTLLKRISRAVWGTPIGRLFS